MSDGVRDLLVRGIAAAKAKDKPDARRYLERVLHLDPTPQQCLQAWYWLSEVCELPQEQRYYLESILTAAPNHPEAIRKLAILDGRLKPEQIIDPNRLVISLDQAGEVDATRFSCPRCGGRLSYTPDGSGLVCERCAVQQAAPHQPAAAGPDTLPQPGAFTLTLATLKGHNRPLGARTFACQACGAVFQFDAQDLSANCPYCASTYVVVQVEDDAHFAVAAVLPILVTQQTARLAFKEWLASQRLALARQKISLRGLYLPAWQFSVNPHFPISFSHNKPAPTDPNANAWRSLVSFDVVVPASRALPAVLSDEVEIFDLSQLVAYDPAYLANWPAETYQVSLSDASLAARWRALQRLRRDAEGGLFGQVNLSELTSMDITIERYQLVLLPFWRTTYIYQEKRYAVWINGQNGRVRGETPHPLGDKLARLFGLSEE